MNSIQYLTPPPQSTVPTRQRLSGFSHAALGFSPTSGARFSSLPALPTFQRFSPPCRSAAARDSQRPRDSVCRPPAPRVSVRCRRPRRAGELQLLLPRTPPRVAGPRDSLRRRQLGREKSERKQLQEEEWRLGERARTTARTSGQPCCSA